METTVEEQVKKVDSVMQHKLESRAIQMIENPPVPLEDDFWERIEALFKYIINGEKHFICFEHWEMNKKGSLGLRGAMAYAECLHQIGQSAKARKIYQTIIDNKYWYESVPTLEGTDQYCIEEIEKIDALWKKKNPFCFILFGPKSIFWN
ncbi:MAG TPA: hypothetical protein VL576_01115 [Candidatus Paceibacterota bacterium]|jgi:hypothetical protein|nr:hypothetical protein [Candidatus Paceibacterota bacterium]